MAPRYILVVEEEVATQIRNAVSGGVVLIALTGYGERAGRGVRGPAG